ncbi:MAG: NADP-dependent isocitrate dehydrogenase [Flavobacteriales bacterium]|nr:NADP-dependent isocitrate dehydrogenase [Flavobacteriales bacterium]MDW8431958.1 NADP-dependent isocitrate dehydrogenase [Flavobacteriales bacterium]
MSSTKVPITVAYGDGIGPEIMEATLRIIEAAGAQIEKEVIEIGEKVYMDGYSSGIKPEAWESLRRTKVFLKAPITTPQGGGFKSLNVTVRKVLGLYANIRPCVSYHPFVKTKHPVMDVVIVRENEEDLYAGIEHRQTDEVVQCLKLISRPGCERIVRYAFEYARAYGRKKVTCFSKDNIMKMTDGLFHKVFDEIGAEYPDLEKEHWIVDIGAAKLADTPEAFDVVVMPNLYGDILSDVAAQITGSVGLAGSANIGDGVAMFEAIHGSAPRRAGQNMANPSGLLLGAVQMLVHIGQADVAERVQNAWLCTLEEGIHTYDIFKEDTSKVKVGTREFADAVIERLGRKPQTLKPVKFSNATFHIRPSDTQPAKKELIGVDIFLHHKDRNADRLGEALKKFKAGHMELSMITNRGTKVWPGGFPETFCTDHWRCRFKSEELKPSGPQDVLNLMQQIVQAGFEIIKTENLYTFDGEPGFSAGQGQ